MADMNWYVIHTYSGYENKVKMTLELKVQSLGMEDVIGRILVPTEDVLEEKNGVERIVKRKIFPGYVMVEMEVNDQSWFVVRNTPGVTGFVGADKNPKPLSEAEVVRILGSQEHPAAPVRNIDMAVGDLVRIKSGAFEDKEGTVTAVDVERGILTVLVEVFQQETPVEIDYYQVERVY